MPRETHTLLDYADKKLISGGKSLYDGFEIVIEPYLKSPLISIGEKFCIGEDENGTPIYTGFNLLLLDIDIHKTVGPHIAPFNLKPYDNRQLFYPGSSKQLIVPVSYPFSHMRESLPNNYYIESINEVRIRFKRTKRFPHYYNWVTDIYIDFIEKKGGLLEEVQTGRFRTGAKFNISQPDCLTPFQMVRGGEFTEFEVLETPTSINGASGLPLEGINHLSDYQDDIDAVLRDFHP